MSFQTQLRIFRRNGLEIPFPPGSYRWADISTRPIPSASKTARTIDGRLISLGDPAFRQLEVTVSVSDQVAPALDNLWEGDELTIHSPDYKTEAGGVLTLSREPVPGTITAHAADGTVLASPESRTVNVPGAVYVRYRPIFGVKVTAPLDKRSTEGKARVSWTLVCEEDEAVEIVEPGEPGGTDPNPLPDDLVEATGGVVTDYTDEEGLRWRLHEFLSSGLFTVSARGRVQALVAGAGGGGGHNNGGDLPGSGPGAGGLFLAEFDVEVGFHAVEIGAGGAPAVGGSSSTNVSNGSQGSASKFHGIEAPGGGGGRGVTTANGWPDGGSGAGQVRDIFGPVGLGKPYYGHGGGTGGQDGDSDKRATGGGGGAGSRGGNGAPGVKSGDAGTGVDMGWFFGEESRILCAGAAGGENSSSPGAAAGQPATGGSLPGQNGAQNTGNAGGACGGTSNPQGGAGASGIVAIRYRIPAE
ncbi:hypothetical protein BXY70_1319 [Roseovarius halotolerans]|uniref:Glycine-rich domain-containing protein n=1 Tax=Roseovarius halotolerans TaxID=505353 RepID=A0A1X6Y7F9_9RHOB|nr:hypothetical protein [Roseovarius halotolerans]RKT35286.1 hypothetical protein BXY70_1319 [Roseovarius halotolerans]SLN11222.1 hypothetical protein ROH8110_00077 [Roseovarius halotolerans]